MAVGAGAGLAGGTDPRHVRLLRHRGTQVALLGADPAGIDALQVPAKCKVREVAALPSPIHESSPQPCPARRLTAAPPLKPCRRLSSCLGPMRSESSSSPTLRAPSATTPQALLFWVHSANAVCTPGVSLRPFHPCNTYSSSTTFPSLHRPFSKILQLQASLMTLS